MNQPVSFSNHNIRKFYKGAVVQSLADGPCWRMVGHVESFSMNSFQELCVVVSFCNGITALIHHAHLCFPGEA